MATVCGFVEKIKYRNEDNGYTVLSLVDAGEEYTLVGSFHYISEGEMIEAVGSMTEHPVYGEQMTVESYEIKAPEDTAAMERYLGSGAIKGIGAALASRIVRRFKADTFRVMEEEPERLSEVKGVSEKMAMSISQQVEEKKEMRQAMMFLQEYGITMNLAVKIYQEYGPRLYSVLKENPYQLADDIPGVGFKMADEIARKAGIFTDSDFRIKCGVLYILLQATANGHTYLPEEELLSQASELLKIEPSFIEKHLMDMQLDKRLVIRELEGKRIVYASLYYYMELNVAKMLHDLNIRGRMPEEEIQTQLLKLQKEEQIELDEKQVQAVVEAVNSGLLIITGGPGTGKTTTINTIIRFFESQEMEILLAAPTGRAAKRMTEATGYEARTIHRLLELTGVPGDDRSLGMHFERNEENPLDADAVIIDETSMVDIHLMQSLLKAINPGTRLILVGDVNQLPSVGPGNVLRDMIDSGSFNVVMLTKIFRQATQSDIVVNAHKINRGEQVPLGKKSNDFLFIKREDPNSIINAMITLVQDKLPGYVHAKTYDIQIMTPMRKGAIGVERLNTILQEYLNPPGEGKAEKETTGVTYRVGDKVMQIKNNYNIEWEVRNKYGIPMDKGTGVYNGDMGIVREINAFAELVTVEFDERRMVEYSFKQLEELELAYAITIHKSQGSEYPAVVIPVFSGPRMLMTRNLIYTAVTRAKSCVCLVGMPEIFGDMVNNEMEQRRYSGLKDRICEISKLN
ncbi:ATP-dependent RecD-like DNA helicase [Lacrimispora sphenoides]|uniref:ATP-dependent RecD2 DNA helicase n=1 Tax=Lacrimispora sphenoides JCM 1415 TaxID=1297793 RepID=A0ABY1CHT4_9FIRM|nr:ATP-dependent RecD-like DNA helicase [Lacrimispora sphenoides]SEU05490.1 exodeoxyribonuclease V alpha subunit [[Clostridium] sphenoides JCM 1415]SUY49013.1 RecD/TraA family helicase [Lacrimispora sphenoides]